MIHSPPICECCFPVNATPTWPWPHHECKPNSKCGQGTVLWSWGSAVRLGQGRDALVDLWCPPAQETVWPVPEFPIHRLRATTLHCPTGNPSAGSRWRDPVHRDSSSSSCAGKNNSSGFSLLPSRVRTTWSRDFFYFHPTENNPSGSWKQPLFFLLAISSLFSHVHLSNECGDAWQERFLLNFF